MEKKFSKRSIDIVESYTGEDFINIKDVNRNGRTNNYKENIHFKKVFAQED